MSTSVDPTLGRPPVLLIVEPYLSGQLNLDLFRVSVDSISFRFGSFGTALTRGNRVSPASDASGGVGFVLLSDFLKEVVDKNPPDSVSASHRRFPFQIPLVVFVGQNEQHVVKLVRNIPKIQRMLSSSIRGDGQKMGMGRFVTTMVGAGTKLRADQEFDQASIRLQRRWFELGKWMGVWMRKDEDEVEFSFNLEEEEGEREFEGDSQQGLWNYVAEGERELLRQSQALNHEQVFKLVREGGFHGIQVFQRAPVTFLGSEPFHFNNHALFISGHSVLNQDSGLIAALISRYARLRGEITARMIVVLRGDDSVSPLMRKLDALSFGEEFAQIVHFLSLKPTDPASFLSGFAMSLFSLDLRRSVRISCGDRDPFSPLFQSLEEFVPTEISAEQLISADSISGLVFPQQSDGPFKFAFSKFGSCSWHTLLMTIPPRTVFPLCTELSESSPRFHVFRRHLDRVCGACVVGSPRSRHEHLEMMLDRNDFSDLYEVYSGVEMAKTMPSGFFENFRMIDEEVEESPPVDSRLSSGKKKPKKKIIKKNVTISLQDLIDFFGAVFFQRGRDYWLESRVSELSSEKEEDDVDGVLTTTIFSKCRGSVSEPYEQTSVLRNGRVDSSTCSCPVAESCKHCCAQLLEFFKFEKSIETQLKPECFRSAFSNLSNPAWAIKGYVTGDKRSFKHWVNDHSSGVVASVLLRDAMPLRPSKDHAVKPPSTSSPKERDVCRIVMFNDQVDKFYRSFRPGCLYVVARGHVRPSNPIYDTTSSVEYDVLLLPHSTVRQLTFSDLGRNGRDPATMQFDFQESFRKRMGRARVGDFVAFGETGDEDDLVVGEVSSKKRKRGEETFPDEDEEVIERPPKRRKIASSEGVQPAAAEASSEPEIDIEDLLDF